MVTPQISRKTLRRLRLRKGDILVVTGFDSYTTIQRLMDVGRDMNLGFDVPIIALHTDQTLKVVCRKYIEKLSKEEQNGIHSQA